MDLVNLIRVVNYEPLTAAVLKACSPHRRPQPPGTPQDANTRPYPDLIPTPDSDILIKFHRCVPPSVLKVFLIALRWV